MSTSDRSASVAIPARRGGGREVVAGMVAAGLALGVTELVSAISARGRPSLIATVGSRLIDRGAGSFRDFAVSVFGTNDKTALVVGIVVVSLLCGAVLGPVTARRRWVGVTGFVAFAIVGVAAGLDDRQASKPTVVVAAVTGAAAGIATLIALLHVASRLPAADVEVAPRPGPGVGSRRAFLAAAAGAAALALVAEAGARRVRSAATRGRAAIRLPAPRRATAVPPGQPFKVDGLSSYVTPASTFYRIDTALFVPQVDAMTWRLAIKGMVDREVSLTYADLLAMDLVEEPVTLACVSNEVGGDLVGNALWRGVPLTTLLDLAGVKPGATQIVGRSVDGFTVGFPIEKALDGRSALVAVGMNGEPLPANHGFPARLVVAGLYGYVSATKWLQEIELTRLEDFDAYWIPRGWAKEGPIKTQSRIDVPRAGATLAAGRVAVAGVAWAPTRGIAKVEVRINDGPWQEARLGDVASHNTWVQWLYEWDATRGRHEITARATDGTGEVQTEMRRAPRPDGATGHHQRLVLIS